MFYVVFRNPLIWREQVEGPLKNGRVSLRNRTTRSGLARGGRASRTTRQSAFASAAIIEES